VIVLVLEDMGGRTKNLDVIHLAWGAGVGGRKGGGAWGVEGVVIAGGFAEWLFLKEGWC